MMNRPTPGLRWKLNLIIGAILLVTMVLFVGLDLHHERQSLISARAQHLEELAQHLAWVVQRAGGQDQQKLVMDYEHAINGSARHDVRALILNARSEVMAATNPHLLGTVMDEESLLRDYQRIAGDTPTKIFVQDTSRMLAALPIFIRAGDRREGSQPSTIMVSSSLEGIRDNLKASLITHTFHLLLTALAMMMAINLALSRLVLEPIQNLLTSMNRMAQGDWNSTLPITSNDEVGQLTKGYNALGRNLEQTVRRLVRAEKLASIALVAIHLNRELRKPIEQIRASARYLCRHNAFDRESSRAVGCIFDQTERMYAISESFDQEFSAQCDVKGKPGPPYATPDPPVDHVGVING